MRATTSAKPSTPKRRRFFFLVSVLRTPSRANASRSTSRPTPCFAFSPGTRARDPGRWLANATSSKTSSSDPGTVRNLTLASMTLTRWLKHESVETAARITGLNTPWPRNRNQRHETPRYGLECTPCQYAASKPEAIPVAAAAAARIGHHARAGSLGTGMCACFAAVCAATSAVAIAFSMRSLPRCTSVDARFDTLCRKRDLARENVGRRRSGYAAAADRVTRARRVVFPAAAPAAVSSFARSFASRAGDERDEGAGDAFSGAPGDAFCAEMRSALSTAVRPPGPPFADVWALLGVAGSFFLTKEPARFCLDRAFDSSFLFLVLLSRRATPGRVGDVVHLLACRVGRD